jgi:hypothetical protein
MKMHSHVLIAAQQVKAAKRSKDAKPGVQACAGKTTLSADMLMIFCDKRGAVQSSMVARQLIVHVLFSVIDLLHRFPS